MVDGDQEWHDQDSQNEHTHDNENNFLMSFMKNSKAGRTGDPRERSAAE